MEIWKQINDWPYEVSDNGRVRRSVGDGHNAISGHILKSRPDKDGYIIVHLCKNGKPKTFKVHRLVCEAFNGPALNKTDYECQHINGTRSDNTPLNLKWGTPKTNAQDRDLHGNTRKGENHSKSRLSQQEVDCLRQEYFNLKQTRISEGKIRIKRTDRIKLSKKYGININTLASLVRGRGYA